LLVFITLCTLSAQSAEVITDIVREEKTTWKSLTYLAYYTDLKNESAQVSPLDTFEYFYNAGVIPANITPDTLLRYDDMGLFLLKVFDVKITSILYYCFETRRYAFRQIKYFGIFQQDAFPGDKMNGSFFVTIMGKFSSVFPDAKIVFNNRGYYW
jgi:hypothetical protein